MNPRTLVLLSLWVMTALAPLRLAAEIPRSLNYQGRLMDETGRPVSGVYDFRFTIYDNLNGGNQIWQLSSPPVGVSNGLYTVELGPFDSSVKFDIPYWLKIEVRPTGSAAAFQTLTPRIALLSSPYTMRSDYATVASSVTFINRDDWTALTGSGETNLHHHPFYLGPNTVGGYNIIDSTITADDLAENAVSSSTLANNAVVPGKIANGSYYLDTSTFTLGAINVSSITASNLHLRAGRSEPNSAPLKFAQGPLLATTENGAMEFNGTNAYITTNSGRDIVLASSASKSGLIALLYANEDDGTRIESTGGTGESKRCTVNCAGYNKLIVETDVELYNLMNGTNDSVVVTVEIYLTGMLNKTYSFNLLSISNNQTDGSRVTATLKYCVDVDTNSSFTPSIRIHPPSNNTNYGGIAKSLRVYGVY